MLGRLNIYFKRRGRTDTKAPHFIADDCDEVRIELTGVEMPVVTTEEDGKVVVTFKTIKSTS